MMYYYWKEKGIRPSVFYSMPKGEQVVVRAFFEQELDDKLRKARAMEGKSYCPMML